MRVIFAVCENPLQAEESTTLHVVEGPISIQQFINENLPPTIARVASVVHEFDARFLSQAKVDNSYVLPDQWNEPLRDGDYVILAPVVGYAWIPMLIKALVVLVVGLIIFSLMGVDTGDGASTTTQYSLSQLKNEQRKGEPVKYCCGKLMRTPDYIAKPYTTYSDNEQYLFTSFCVGIGKFVEHGVYFEDTLTSNYSGTSVAKIEPYGSAIPLYSQNNVWTNSEVDSIELYAPNEGTYHSEDPLWNGYPTGGYYGWYNANKAGTTAREILVDVILPEGLGYTDLKARKQYWSVSYTIEYREVIYSSTGEISYGSIRSQSHTIRRRKQGVPIRITHRLSDASGVIQVRMKRTSNRASVDNKNSYSELLQWGALRAVLPSVLVYDANITCYQVKAKAMNGLSNAASQRFRSLCTAMKPVYDPATKTWDDDNPIETRNPIWAFCDIVRNEHFGNLSDRYLDMDVLYPIAVECDENGIYFDYDFDSYKSLSEQLAVIARILRAQLDFSGNKISLIRDLPSTLPNRVFTKENIVKDSFKISYSAPTQDDKDGTLAEYTDPKTWDPESVLTTLSGEDGSNPETSTIQGVTDRTQAWRIAYYERYNDKMRKEIYSLDTDRSAADLEVFSLVYLDHPLITSAGISANIVSIDESIVELDQNVKLNMSGSYDNTVVVFDRANGGTKTTHTATYYDYDGGDYHTLVLDPPLDPDGIPLDDPQAYPVCVIGLDTNYATLCKVMSKAYSGDNVTLTVYPYDAGCFWADDKFPESSLPMQTTDDVPSAPEGVSIVFVRDELDAITGVTVSWEASAGYTSYSVQYSVDRGVTWLDMETATTELSVTADIVPESFILARVAVIYNGLVWSWGYSEEISTSDTIWVSTDDYVWVSADDYVVVFKQG